MICTYFFAYPQKDSCVYEIGKTYFRTYCSSCHAVDQEIYGPMLASISKKKEHDWLILFIRNSQSVIQSGDLYAKELFENFDHKTMPTFEQLSSKNIDAILYYIEIESLQPNVYLNDLDISTPSDSSVIYGKHEFIEHCSMCHFIHKESTFAPALGSVTKRHSREWLLSFIQNSQKKINNHDSYAEYVFDSYDKHIMTQMEFMDVDEINSILDYIEFESTVHKAYTGKINKHIDQNEALHLIKNTTINRRFFPVVGCCMLVSVLLLMLLHLYLLLIFVKHVKINQQSLVINHFSYVHIQQT